MNFIVRPAREDDLEQVFDLSKQFSLLNLPADKNAITSKIEKSFASFSGEISAEEREYLFVMEDLESKKIAGSSQVKAKHGTEESPTYSFKILKKERFSKDLGVGFIHQILRLNICTDGPTEVGGLVVDKHYRRRPEKIGKVMSLNRFLYIGMNRKSFEKDLLAEMAPPLTDEGRSEFWESLGRRFTGMPYQEADAISHQNKEFIKSLFPEEDIYLCLLDSKARLVLGRVSEETMPALHLLEGIGFKYREEVDPFDGGPHLYAPTKKVKIIDEAQNLTLKSQKKSYFGGVALIAIEKDGEFISGASAYNLDGKNLDLPNKTRKAMDIADGDKIYSYILEKKGKDE